MAPPNYYTPGDPYTDPYYSGQSYYTPPAKPPSYTSALQAVIDGYGIPDALPPTATGMVPSAPSVPGVGGQVTPAGAELAGGGLFDVGGIGGAGNAILPVGGALLGVDAYGRDGAAGYGEAALAGAGLGSYFGPVGAGVGAAAGLGLKGVQDFFGGKPQTEQEDKRFQKLKEAGAPGYQGEFRKTKDPNAWYRKDLAPDFVGTAPDTGEWTNNKFAMSRNKADLTGRDIWGYSAFGEKFGNDWGNTSEANREAIANEALKRGLVDEHHGTIDIANDSGFDQYARDLIAGRAPGSADPAFTKLPSSQQSARSSSMAPITSSIPAIGKKIGKTVDRSGDTPSYKPLAQGQPQATKAQAVAALTNAIPRFTEAKPSKSVRFDNEQTFRHAGNSLFQNDNSLTARLNRIPRKK